MRAIVAIIVGVLLSLSGCSRPPQAGHPQHVRSSWLPLQSQPSVRKLTRASSTKFARPVSKRAKKFKAPLAKPTRTPVESPASADVSPSLPPRKPALTPIPSPAIDAGSTPPVPQRKPEETPTGPADTHEHAVEADAKFMAAKEKAKREGVYALTNEDIRGLSQEQIKELRGY
jgi:hypothetical protein